eukprot:Lankesteria_metandrocarpae@DN463_c0_g1_i1.p1
MLSNFFSAPCSIDIQIGTDRSRKTTHLGTDKNGEKVPIFSDGEDMSGVALINLKPGKRLEHQGIKAELIGQVEMFSDKSMSYNFFSISKDLEPQGTLFESKQFRWKFTAVDKPYETYCGKNVRLRYFIRITVNRSFTTNISKESDFAVQNIEHHPELNSSIKMEVGIEDCLHIEFEYDKSKYHLKDAIIGKVYFMLVRIKIKHMELDVTRTETAGSGAAAIIDSEPVTKFEIMDGAPVRSECIPVRLYLSGLDLTPSYRNVLQKFSVKYYVNLVLVDEEDRRYFKKQEITLWRRKVG